MRKYKGQKKAIEIQRYSIPHPYTSAFFIPYFSTPDATTFTQRLFHFCLSSVSTYFWGLYVCKITLSCVYSTTNHCPTHPPLKVTILS